MSLKKNWVRVYMAGKTDRQTDKSTRWAFTAYENQYDLLKEMPPGVAEWGWNSEICPETGRPHRQGFIRLHQQQRLSWFTTHFKGMHVEIAKNWQGLLKYCQKEDTREIGTQPIHQVNSIPTHFQYAETLAKEYLEIFGEDDIDECQWPSIHTARRTGLNSVQDRLDMLINRDIKSGKRYAAWITTNPQWETMWKSKWKPFILSFKSNA